MIQDGLSRREFVRLTSAAVAGGWTLGLTRRARAARVAAEAFYEWKEIAPGILVALNRTGDTMSIVGGNSTLVTGGKGALLVDTKQAVLGPSLVREALARTDKIAQCINTHHHFDHAGGNHALTARRVPITSHGKAWIRLQDSMNSQVAQIDDKIKALEECGVAGAKEAAEDARRFREHLADLKPAAWEPVGRLSGDARMDVAARRVDIRWFGGGHTDNDLVIHLPAENVVLTGDLVFHGLHPYYDASADANTARWVKSLEAIETLCNDKTVVVPGHGPVSDVSCVRAQAEYFKRMRGVVEDAVKAGRTREEIVKMDPPEAYRAFGLRVALGYLLGGLFDELHPKAEPAKEPPAKPSGS
jgi:glyoxylase-like metal-dependent hydrolase (beta-lactamase superfamily II)